MFSCILCSKNFSSKQRLKYHIKNRVCIENELVTCGICNKVFKNDKTLKIHTVKCLTNLNIYANFNTQSHTNFTQSHTIPHKNEIDVKKDINIIREEIFNDLNTLYCEYCNKSFSRNDSVIRHKNKYCKVKNNEK
jgi:uncharacterized Zn-finger protein